ncbi:hypothetical protein JCM10213_006501 [Rhodosporidiobolus nylandii]
MVNVTYDAQNNMQTWVDGEPFTYNGADMGWILVSAVLVMIMAPGVGLLYSGLLRRKNALSMVFLSLMVFSMAAIQWFLFGYSLAFSETGNSFIGNFANGGLVNVDIQPSGSIPVLLFAFYQSMFAGVTQVIVVGGAAERGRILPVMLFLFAWSIIVYCPVANWVWNANGWIYQLGDLDYAGGGPVHITSGTASFALSFFLGKRRGYGTAKLAYRPHSVSHVILGTVFLWFGWFGFNGGSALGMNLRAVQSCVATNVAAATAALTWTAIDYIYTRKLSAVSFCSGVLAGLVAVTPAAGYIGTPAAMAIGFLGAIACNYATGLKVLLGVDDSVDAFAIHGLGGAAKVYALRPSPWIQLGYQLAACVTIMAYTFVVSLILLYLVNWIPGCKLRAHEDSEIVGMDEAESGELLYDFVQIRRDVDDEPPATATAVNSVHSGEKVVREASK